MTFDDGGGIPPFFDNEEFEDLTDAFSLFDAAYDAFTDNYDPFDDSIFNAVRFDDMRDAFDKLDEQFDDWTDSIGPSIYEGVGHEYESDETVFTARGFDRVVNSDWPLQDSNFSARGPFPSMEDAARYLDEFGMYDLSYVYEDEYGDFEVYVPDNTTGVAA